MKFSFQIIIIKLKGIKIIKGRTKKMTKDFLKFEINFSENSHTNILILVKWSKCVIPFFIITWLSWFGMAEWSWKIHHIPEYQIPHNIAASTYVTDCLLSYHYQTISMVCSGM